MSDRTRPHAAIVKCQIGWQITIINSLMEYNGRPWRLTRSGAIRCAERKLKRLTRDREILKVQLP